MVNVRQICKIGICLIVLIPLIISVERPVWADDTVVDEKKVKVSADSTMKIVPRDEIQRIANKTDESISKLKGKIMSLENEIDGLKKEIEYLRLRLSKVYKVCEDSLGL